MKLNKSKLLLIMAAGLFLILIVYITISLGTPNVEESINYWKELNFPETSLELFYPPAGDYSSSIPKGALARMGKGSFNDFAISPDGKYLVISTSLGLYLFDVNSFQLQWYQKGKWRIEKLVFSLDGSMVGGMLSENAVAFNAATGERMFEFNMADFHFGYDGYKYNQIESPNGKYAAVVERHYIQIFFQNTKKEYKNVLFGDEYIDLMAWSPDSKWIAVGLDNDWYEGNMQFVNIKSGKVIFKANKYYPLGWSNGNNIDWSHDSTLVFVGEGDGSISVWNPWTGKQVLDFSGHKDQVLSVKTLSEDAGVISADIDGRVLYRKNQAQSFFEIGFDFVSEIRAMDWTHDGKTLVSSSWNGDFILWDVESEIINERLDLGFPFDFFNDIKFSPDGTRIAGEVLQFYEPGEELRLVVWDAETMEELYSFGGILHDYDEDVWGIAWSPDGSRIAAVDTGGYLHILDGWTGEIISSVWGFDHYNLKAVTWSPDGKYIAVGVQPNQVSIIKAGTKNWTTLANFDTGDRYDEISGIEWSLDGNNIVVWTRRKVFIIELDGGVITEKYGNDFAFSPDGKLAAISSGSGYISIVETNSWIEVKLFSGHSGIVKWSPDGTILASGGKDGTIVLWDMSPYLIMEEE